MLCILSLNTSAQVPDDDPTNHLSLGLTTNCHYNDSLSHGLIKYPRSQVEKPSVATSGHTLYIISGCDNAELMICNLNGNEIYSTFITEGTESLTLPEWLEGTFELHIHRGNFCFYGEIEL